MKKPGFWRLFGAYGVDFIILLLLVVGANLIFEQIVPAEEMKLKCKCLDPFPTPSSLAEAFKLVPVGGVAIMGIFLAFLNWGYFSFFDGIFGKTIGKMFFAVKTIPSYRTKFPFFRNVFSYLIDSVVLMVAIYCVSVTLEALLWRIAFFYSYSMVSFWMVAILMTVWIVLSTSYFACCESRWGKTLGKKLMGLQVVQEEKTK